MLCVSRLVVINIWVVLFLNFVSVVLCFDWFLLLCRIVVIIFVLLSFLVKLLVFFFVLINISICGYWCCFKRVIKVCVLLFLFIKYSVFCIVWLMLFLGLVEIWVGVCINCCVLSFKLLEKVVEYIMVWCILVV